VKRVRLGGMIVVVGPKMENRGAQIRKDRGGSRGGRGVVEVEGGQICSVVPIEDSLKLLAAS
jgi:hypothetical protein